ncbi:MAG: hypothetical protein KKB21_05715 [Nanoarchaeota archaeon]|nr:hypothetical protein [Nanoarchaeota archaeon]
MVSRKSQLKIQQMAFMLMAVFIFFVLAGMFYILSQSQNIAKKANLLERNNAIGLANMLVDSAEFSCGTYCIDADRAMVLRKKSPYTNGTLWKVNSIKIRTLSNATKDTLCTEANYPDCNLIKVYDKGAGETSVYSYVSVCKRVKENEYIEYRCELGQFIVGYEVKNAK